MFTEQIYNQSKEFLPLVAGLVNSYLITNLALRYGVAANRTGMKMMFLDKKMCDMTIVPETFYPSGYAFALPENSPYRVYFNE